ncbi:hypothetical protein [Halodesulfovibrio spirochaetisodalis]|uniref:Uncharacterized protein n=1 Tax=Halodesulfovibrio spirochaetisodalis TaxID=1560234 RepID=A0A1B7X9N3_9BACT|nr:hypothetical protein [Halodesulfovibrio spirochaetisodalis]OBQ46042.1 hypothetical protein SP90_14840 [Halodesulfovibrio spirochaetisodalis]
MLKKILPALGTEPIDRIHTISIIIRSFKGRKNVEAHLFRSDVPESELPSTILHQRIDTDTEKYALEPHLTGTLEDTQRMVLESFTEKERDTILRYLEQRYHTRLKSVSTAPLTFPVPQGTIPLASIPEGKSIGFIRFHAVPNYPLDFNFSGFYDLELHEPNMI